jgi:hypothetical protein
MIALVRIGLKKSRLIPTIMKSEGKNRSHLFFLRVGKMIFNMMSSLKKGHGF